MYFIYHVNRLELSLTGDDDKYIDYGLNGQLNVDDDTSVTQINTV